MTLPDRAGLRTEQRNPRSMRLDTLTVEECVALINEEDATVPAAVARAAPALSAFIHDAVRALRAGGRLIYIGAGTSGRLGVLDAAECPPTFQTDPSTVVAIIAGGDSALRTSSESKEDDPHAPGAELDAININERDILLGVAAGGTTPYVRAAIAHAKSRGARAGILACTPIDPPPGADHTIIIETGPEVLTGSTRMKAGTATKLALNTISTTCMVQLGKAHENLMVDLRATNDKLRDRAARIITELTGAPRAAALELLDRAGNDVKTAVVMRARDTDATRARALLDRHRGVLRDALDDGAQRQQQQ